MKEKTIYALGFFDGVHLGHQALLRACRELADQFGCKAGAVTFATHPETLVTGKAPGLITTGQDRRALLEGYGMDRVVELPFDRALMEMPWQAFFDMLLTRYDAAGFVCGHDFHFGNRGAGTAALLEKVCAEKGLPCRVIPEQKIEGITVSSTYIRRLLEEGQMQTAVRFLGHGYVLSGEVVAGRQLGRTIGVPTANLALPAGLVVPKYGVYAGTATVEGKTYPAVTNIGMRPTVGGAGVTVEAHLLDFDGELYGKTVTLAFLAFLRPEQKFASLEELKEEIQKNAMQTRKLLENQ